MKTEVLIVFGGHKNRSKKPIKGIEKCIICDVDIYLTGEGHMVLPKKDKVPNIEDMRKVYIGTECGFNIAEMILAFKFADKKK